MNKMYYYYAGFPVSFADVNTEDINPIVKDKIKNLEEGVYLFLDQNKYLAKLAKILLENNKFEEVRGIHFPTFFDKILKNDVSLHDIKIPKFLVVYSIGKEAAVNKDYARSLLQFFIDKAILNKTILILSGITTTELRKIYKIEDTFKTLKV